MLALKMEGAGSKECRQPLDVGEGKDGFFPRAFREERSLVNTLISFQGSLLEVRLLASRTVR